MHVIPRNVRTQGPGNRRHHCPVPVGVGGGRQGRGHREGPHRLPQQPRFISVTDVAEYGMDAGWGLLREEELERDDFEQELTGIVGLDLI